MLAKERIDGFMGLYVCTVSADVGERQGRATGGDSLKRGTPRTRSAPQGLLICQHFSYQDRDIQELNAYRHILYSIYSYKTTYNSWS